MLAITGASGHLGRATIQSLLTKVAPAEIVAVVRDPAKAADLTAQGVQVRPGDYNDPASLQAAFAGADAVLLVSTTENEVARRLQQHSHVIDAARQAGVRQLLYTSIVNPSSSSPFEASPGHLATEEYLKNSGLTYTIFRNNLYFDILPGLLGPSVVADGRFFLAAGEGQVSFVLREDIAEALANALTSEGHANATYDISPGPAYSLADVAAAISASSGQPVRYVAVSSEDQAAAMRQQLPEHFVQLLTGMTEAIRDGEFDVVSPALEHLLGRKPTDLQGFANSVYGA